MKWGDVVLPPKPIPLSKYRRRHRPPITNLTSVICVCILWLAVILFLAMTAHDVAILLAAGSGVGMGVGLAVWTRGRRFQ